MDNNRKLYKIGDIMRLTGETRRRIEYNIERLRIKPDHWKAGVRLFSQPEIDIISKKLKDTKRSE